MDPRTLARFLGGSGYEPSRSFRRLLCSEPFNRAVPERRDHHRALVWDWCRWIAASEHARYGLPREAGGRPDLLYHLGRSMAHRDLSLMVKYCIHFGTVPQALARLGTERHWEVMDEVVSLARPACFAMTETAHGSNVRALETVARFDPGEGSFKLHTPHPGAAKDYIVGAAEHARLAVVFARLVVGAEDHGVHAFLVPLRSEDGRTLEGVSITDCGPKGGLNGVDNGSIVFQDLALPREALLDRHARVQPDGTYQRGDLSEARRFYTMLGNLVAGRLTVAAAANEGARSGLTIALRYAQKRRQFGPEGKAEVPLLDYQAHQHRTMPLMAKLFALDTALADALLKYRAYLEEHQEDRELETFVATLKAYATRFSVDALQECRECCGGAGFLSANRLTELRKDLDIFTTFEGDNTVLYLVAARHLLTDFRRQEEDSRLAKALSWVGRGFTLAAQTHPLKSKGHSDEEMTEVDLLSSALRYRRERLRYTLATRLRARLAEGQEVFEAVNRCQAHCLALSHAYVEEKVFRCFRNRLESCPPGWDQQVLSQLCTVYALSCLHDDRGWFLEQGYFSARQTQAMRDLILRLSYRLSRQCDSLLTVFELPEQLFRVPLLS